MECIHALFLGTGSTSDACRIRTPPALSGYRFWNGASWDAPFSFLRGFEVLETAGFWRCGEAFGRYSALVEFVSGQGLKNLRMWGNVGSDCGYGGFAWDGMGCGEKVVKKNKKEVDVRGSRALGSPRRPEASGARDESRSDPRETGRADRLFSPLEGDLSQCGPVIWRHPQRSFSAKRARRMIGWRGKRLNCVLRVLRDARSGCREVPGGQFGCAMHSKRFLRRV